MTVFNHAKKPGIQACTLWMVFLFLGCCINDTSAKNAPGMPLSAPIVHPGIVSDTENIVALTDFGVKPNSFENASAGVKKALRFCKASSVATLLLPGGRIDLWPEYAFKQELYIWSQKTVI